ncbi:hypothetical protein [Achromobacter insuavis]|uniref:hypothetical protein n=1 Tax=Achromobacter insuavis TaxID=1287735 RepID=UPI001EEA49F2|nr:hypothetical protein [Achromobacter insuavis]
MLHTIRASTLDVRLTANARALGSAQIDMFKAHSHTIPNQGAGATTASLTNGNGDSNTYPTGTSGGAETRPVNTAYHPRIHV